MKRSASRNGNQRYDVHLSGAVAKRVRQLMRRALRERRGKSFVESYRNIIEQLREKPGDCGEPLYQSIMEFARIDR